MTVIVDPIPREASLLRGLAHDIDVARTLVLMFADQRGGANDPVTVLAEPLQHLVNEHRRTADTLEQNAMLARMPPSLGCRILRYAMTGTQIILSMVGTLVLIAVILAWQLPSPMESIHPVTINGHRYLPLYDLPNTKLLPTTGAHHDTR